MFVSLTQVKINNKYDYIKSVAPTANDDSSAGFAVGETWLNTTDGLSYQANDVTIGAAVWVRIEESEDNIILLNGDKIFKQILKNLNNNFIVDRNKAFESINSNFPDNSIFTRQKAYKLVETESAYSEWVFNSSLKTITGGETVYGSIENIDVGDVILIEDSLKNNDYYNITATASNVLKVAEDIKNGTENAFISLVVFPLDFITVVARLIWHDIFKEDNNGLKSERIGTYSYTLEELAKNGYPKDVIRGLQAYERISVGGNSYYVN